MKLITRYELANLSLEELHGVYRQVFNALAQIPPHTLERSNALGSLENIGREIGNRHNR